MHKTNESAMITVMKLDEEIAEIKKQFKESPNAEVPQLNALMDLLVKTKGDETITNLRLQFRRPQ